MPKNVIILATASHGGGAYAIYQQFLTTLRAFVQQELTITGHTSTDFRFFLFVDPTMVQPELPNVQYIPIATPAFKRITFDFYGLRKEINRRGIHPHVFISFQNTGAHYDKITPWLVYFHNIIPLEPCRWLPFKHQHRSLFFYSALYPHYVRYLTPRYADIIVQAEFIRQAFIRKFAYPSDKVHVLSPQLSLPDTSEIVPYGTEPNTCNLFFPAAEYDYKRHDLLLSALALLQERHPETANHLRLHFTFNPRLRPDLVTFIERYKISTQVCFHGTLPFSTILQLYKASDALLFPSELETLGLPLLEAATFGLPILVADRPYAREAIGHYTGTQFLPPNDIAAWANALEQLVATKPKHFPTPSLDHNNTWVVFLQKALDKTTTTSS